MKSTQELLFEMITVLSDRMDVKKVGELSQFKQMEIVNSTTAEYASLIDANKIITKND